MKKLLYITLLFTLSCTSVGSKTFSDYSYPKEWFEPVNDPNAPKWEILPQEAGPGEVILSKRNELGILSNFAATPIDYRGKTYASIEGLWQSMKYPENAKDERAKYPGIKWDLKRSEIEKMSGFKAKRAGKQGSQNMKTMGIDWVSFEGEKMVYRTLNKGRHYDVIREAMRQKVRQNPEVKRILLATGDLKLRPDHKTREPSPPAWKYYQIYMEIRSELMK